MQEEHWGKQRGNAQSAYAGSQAGPWRCRAGQLQMQLLLGGQGADRRPEAVTRHIG